MFLSSLGTKVIKKDLNNETLSLKKEHYWQPYLTAQAPSAHWAEGCTEFLSQESFEFPQVNSECAPCKWDWALGLLWHLLSREQEAAQLDYCSLLPWFQFSSQVLGRPGWSIVSAFSGLCLAVVLQLLLSLSVCGAGLKLPMEGDDGLLFTQAVWQVRTAVKRCCFLTLFWHFVERGFHKNAEFRTLLLPSLQNPSGTAGRFLQKLLCIVWLRLCMKRLDVLSTVGLCWGQGHCMLG